MWARCPKNWFCEAVCTADVGAASNALMTRSCEVNPDINMMKALHREDTVRLYHASKKVRSQSRKQSQRQQLRSKTKAKADRETYNPGLFGTRSQPDYSKKETRKSGEIMTMETSEPGLSQIAISFVVSDVEVVHAAKWQLFLIAIIIINLSTVCHENLTFQIFFSNQ